MYLNVRLAFAEIHKMETLQENCPRDVPSKTPSDAISSDTIVAWSVASSSVLP